MILYQSLFRWIVKLSLYNHYYQDIGDSTIIPCIGSCTHITGIRINLNTLKVTKFIDYPPEQIISNVEELKEIFNQYDILMNTIECDNFRIV